MAALCFVGFAVGCGRFHHDKHDTVYVWVRAMYLRDRVAAVSNRVCQVTNGQKLEVLEHGRRFYKVKTEKNEIGWIPDRSVIDGTVFAAFDQLATQHKNDAPVATATLRDENYLHVSPGRDTDRFYLLPENDKLALLARSTAPKNAPAQPAAPKPAAPKPVTAPAPAQPSARPAGTAPAPRPEEAAAAAPEPPPVVLEDWWLVRDKDGRTGWILSGRMDVDVPDDVAQYAEGQRIVSAAILKKVYDDEAPTADHMVAEYVTALSEPKGGLPYDFDQIRVFTWSLKRHRYETAYRLRPIQGFFPLKVGSEPAPGGSEPVFSFQIARSPDVSVDPQTGVARPANPRTIRYALRDTQVKRVGPDLDPIPTGKKDEDKDKAANAAKSKKKH